MENTYLSHKLFAHTSGFVVQEFDYFSLFRIWIHPPKQPFVQNNLEIKSDMKVRKIRLRYIKKRHSICSLQDTEDKKKEDWVTMMTLKRRQQAEENRIKVGYFLYY
jgi:hypothetical protein